MSENKNMDTGRIKTSTYHIFAFSAIDKSVASQAMTINLTHRQIVIKKLLQKHRTPDAFQDHLVCNFLRTFSLGSVNVSPVLWA